MRADRNQERDIAEALIELLATASQEAGYKSPGLEAEPGPQLADPSAGAVLAALLGERLSPAELAELRAIVEKLLD